MSKLRNILQRILGWWRDDDGVLSFPPSVIINNPERFTTGAILAAQRELMGEAWVLHPSNGPKRGTPPPSALKTAIRRMRNESSPAEKFLIQCERHVARSTRADLLKAIAKEDPRDKLDYSLATVTRCHSLAEDD